MSRIVNIIFETSAATIFSHIEDAKTGEQLSNVGRWLAIEDDMQALQLRVMDLRNRTDDDGICPCCTQKMPKPPDMSRRSLP